MWGRHKKIREWIEAGVLSEPQAQAIEAYEQGRKKSRFGNGLINLSVFAILIGVLSIIASNWYKIPGDIKIGAHVLLNIGIGALALWADKKDKDVWREGATLAFLGLTMTLIVLIGQVFQLPGSPTTALLLWLLITLPFFLLMGRTYATAVPWMIAYLVTLVMVVSEYVPLLPKDWQQYVYIGLPALMPLSFMAKGALEFFKRWRPALASVVLKTGIALSAWFASASLVIWGSQDMTHVEPDISNRQCLVILAIGLAATLIHAVFCKFYKNDPRLKYGALFAAMGLVLMMLPFIAPTHGGPIIAALAFIAYWIFIGWTAQNMGHMRAVTFAIIVIAIRIFAIYVEVFGSLMDTGVGLIVGGIVMLVLIYAARKLNTRIRAKGAFHAPL